MLHRETGSCVTVDNIRKLETVHDVFGKPGFYKIQHRKQLANVMQVSTHALPLGVSFCGCFRDRPLAFRLVTAFSSDGDMDHTELGSVIRGLSRSRRHVSVFKSLDLMMTIRWFIYDVPPPLRLRSRHKERSESKSEGGILVLLSGMQAV